MSSSARFRSKTDRKTRLRGLRTWRQTKDRPAPDRGLAQLELDLHDGPLQDLAAIASGMRPLREHVQALATAASDGHVALQLLDEVTEGLIALDRDLRQVTWRARTDRLLARPFREILIGQVERLETRDGIEAAVEIRGDFDALPPQIRVTVLQVTQEALANVRRHSLADEVRLAMRAEQGRVDVEVFDNGSGFDIGDGLRRAVKSRKLGLLGMAERVSSLGGKLDIESAPGGPTRVRLALDV
jgi:signal transduction histidine kinase